MGLPKANDNVTAVTVAGYLGLAFAGLMPCTYGPFFSTS